MDDIDDKLTELASDNDLPGEIVYDTPNRVIAQLSQKLETHIGDTP